DFTVAPGADPRAIRLGFEGADRLELTADGDLGLHVGNVGLRFAKPLVYQDVAGARREIPGGWVLEEAFTVGFRLAAYDRSKPLVIDPVVSLATYVGGTDTDQAFAIALDTSGNVYLTGNTASANFPTTVGAVQTTFGGPAGGTDAFVVKLDPTFATLVYSTYLGGTTGPVGTTGGGNDAGRGIAVDASGNAYVTGFTNSSDFPTTAGAFQTVFGGGTCSGVPCNDAFVVKLDSAGALVYGTYLGGNKSDVGLGIAVDSSGNSYVTGGTFSTAAGGATPFPTTAGAFKVALSGVLVAFVSMLAPT